jgi:hypothetical protein
LNQIIVTLAGGLGNQLFQTSAALSLRTNETILLDQSLGEPRLNSKYDAEILSFNLPKYFEKVTKKTEHRFCKKTYRLVLRMGLRKRNGKFSITERFVILLAQIILSFHFKVYCKIICNIGVGFSPLKKSNKSMLLIGYFQSYRYSEEPKVMEVMKSFELYDESPKFNLKRSEAKRLEPVIFHVRLSDYLNEPTIGVLSVDYFHTAMREVTELNARPMWVFSDDPEKARRFFELDRSRNIEFFGPDDFSTLETLELMKTGSSLTISNSTFSWWAARLSSPQTRIVIAPEPWFSGQADPIDLIPGGWRRLGR